MRTPNDRQITEKRPAAGTSRTPIGERYRLTTSDILSRSPDLRKKGEHDVLRTIPQRNDHAAAQAAADQRHHAGPGDDGHGRGEIRLHAEMHHPDRLRGSCPAGRQGVSLINGDRGPVQPYALSLPPQSREIFPYRPDSSRESHGQRHPGLSVPVSAGKRHLQRIPGRYPVVDLHVPGVVRQRGYYRQKPGKNDQENQISAKQADPHEPTGAGDHARCLQDPQGTRPGRVFVLHRLPRLRSLRYAAG